MFADDKPTVKPRRYNAKEMETEFQLCSIFKRPPTYYHGDKPTYPWLPLEPLVNFDLKFQ
jgi:hypothetical protein